MKRILSILSIFIIAFAIFSYEQVQANSGTTYTVLTDSLNVRATPSHDGDVIGKLQKGDKVAVFKDKYGWKQTYYNGKEAWVAGQYLSKSNSSPSKTSKNKTETVKQSESVYVSDSGVRLRSGPSTHYQIVGYTNKGDKLQVIQTNGDWKQVRTSSGKVAWIAGWLTSTSEKQTHSQKQAKSTSSNSLKGKNIMLDAGHGGHDPGSTALNGQFEKDLTLSITKEIGNILEAHGATVIYTRNNDRYVSLLDRVNISNLYWTDAFISIHFNAFTSGSPQGVSTHYYNNGDDYRLANSVHSALSNELSLNDRGVQHDNYYVLRENNDASILLELGFITNQSDLNAITSSQYGTQVGNALAEGLKNYFK